MKNIAHRGIWDATTPQNTLPAFNRAWRSGATWVETDFHHTRAGQMICIHHEGELKMYTGCEKSIPELSPEDVASLRLVPPDGAASGAVDPDFRIPLLDEVLATVPPDGTLQSEIKTYSPQYADIFDGAVRNAGLTERNIVVSSFSFDALADFHRRKPAYRTLWLTGLAKDRPFEATDWIKRCTEAGFWAFCPGLSDTVGRLSRSDADAFRASGVSFRVFGVNSPEQLRQARDIGAEAFTCNHWREAFDWAREIGGVTLEA